MTGIYDDGATYGPRPAREALLAELLSGEDLDAPESADARARLEGMLDAHQDEALASEAGERWIRSQENQLGIKWADFRAGRWEMDLTAGRDFAAAYVAAARALLGDALTPHEARQRAEAEVERLRTELAAARTAALTEAADHLDRIADEVEAKVAAYYGLASGIGPGSAGHVRMDAKEIRTLAVAPAPAPADADPIVVLWDRIVIHPADPAEPIIVCCRTDDGAPVALFLTPEHREALGLQLVDPEGE